MTEPKFKVGQKAVVNITGEVVRIVKHYNEGEDDKCVWDYLAATDYGDSRYYESELSPLPRTVADAVKAWLLSIGADGLCDDIDIHPGICYCGINTLFDDAICYKPERCVPARLVNGELVPMKEKP